MEDTTLSAETEKDAVGVPAADVRTEDAPADAESQDTELEGLDDLDDVDFDLDEVENKIAPLALAAIESARW
ncbi:MULTISPECIES: ammosamide/lymphostin RiPP family protein [Streptomyces]|uniref:ammosamide/lymphostin RiPP family protein n=1 Tax=Streptomyces TaxID=1883 RepID=UPI0029312D2E|nr:ammosamide/lymphostin RiPP family protein [Streptomyces sp. NEAU-HV9]